MQYKKIPITHFKLTTYPLVNKNDLMAITGYSETQSKLLIRQAKLLLVEKGFNWYKNKRVGRVPLQTIEAISDNF